MIRYPGTKSRIKNYLVEIIKPHLKSIYIEPFVGTGSVGLSLLQNKCSFWFNDIDNYLIDLWRAVRDHPLSLKNKIKSYTPDVESFNKFKKSLIKNEELDTVEGGFRKLVVHQCSYSGLGVKSGGPLGGGNQKSKYKIDCRWSPNSLCTKIDKINPIIKRVLLTSIDCTGSLLDDLDKGYTLFLDPPYYIQGESLYQFNLDENQHKELRDKLKHTKATWFLTYDDCDEIRFMYNWAYIKEIDAKYSLNKSSGKSKTELLISNIKL